MCGVAGIISGPGFACSEPQRSAMLEAIRHRGPDSCGCWQEEAVWLGHRRLSVIDLSQAGHQPMVSSCGRYVLTYNGEIYNFKTLRQQLTRDFAIAWKGLSDSEVLLELIAKLGVPAALRRLNGMFAFAVWDRHHRRLTLARDQFGEKPLYYGAKNKGFFFASELKSLEVLADLPLTISRESLYWYFHYGYVPAPLSIYEGVAKLLPGHYVEWQDGELSEACAYWSLADVCEAGAANQFTSPQDAIAAVEQALADACRLRMIADVPLGAFLSGGIDSSCVVAMMQAQSARPVKTFTIGFDIPAADESAYAKAIANHLGTDHSDLIVAEQDAIDIVPKLGKLNDEPFADSSSIPTFLVSQMARQQVTVCLSGDGGDELFAGYERYRKMPDLWQRVQKMPFAATAGRLVGAMPTKLLDVALRPLEARANKMGSTPDSVGLKAKRFAERLGASSFAEFYDYVMRQAQHPEALLPGHVGQERGSMRKREPALDALVDWMCWHDSVTYLPGDILTKVDRATMAVSLESRMPMLDPGVAKVAWRIPANMKIRDGTTKWPLRQVLYKYVPQELIDRPKMGFGIPLREWLLGPLREWARDLLSKEKLQRHSLVDIDAATRLVDDFYSGRRPEPNAIWALLMLQCWLEDRS